MADMFADVVQRLWDMGVLKYLFPYMLTSAIFYGLLRKSQIFGKPEDNAAVNAVISMVASFMMFAYPVIAGVDIGEHLVYFFTQSVVVILVITLTLMIAGMFLPPDLPKHLSEGLFQGNKAIAVILIGLIFAFIIVMTSGLWTAVLGPDVINLSDDIFITIIVLILLIVPFIFIMYPSKEKQKGGPNE